MVKVSKRYLRSRKRVRTKGGGKRNRVGGGRVRKRTGSKRRSRTMKKSKRGGSIKKMMGGDMPARQVYCVSCKKKVTVSDYELKDTGRGAYQLVGDCGEPTHKINKNGERKVYTFVSAKDV